MTNIETLPANTTQLPEEDKIEKDRAQRKRVRKRLRYLAETKIGRVLAEKVKKLIDDEDRDSAQLTALTFQVVFSAEITAERREGISIQTDSRFGELQERFGRLATTQRGKRLAQKIQKNSSKPATFSNLVIELVKASERNIKQNKNHSNVGIPDPRRPSRKQS